ncbi:hypothetical protein Trydic_g1999 [Trypoxylus dichotomus]
MGHGGTNHIQSLVRVQNTLKALSDGKDLKEFLDKVKKREEARKSREDFEDTRKYPDARMYVPGKKELEEDGSKGVQPTNDIHSTQKQTTVMVSLELEKEFDKIHHEGLLLKMKDFGFPGRILKIIRSYLQNERFHTVVDG